MGWVSISFKTLTIISPVGTRGAKAQGNYKPAHSTNREEAIKELWQIAGGLTLTNPVTLCPHLNKKGSCKAKMDVKNYKNRDFT